jgi:hypothetical protein
MFHVANSSVSLLPRFQQPIPANTGPSGPRWPDLQLIGRRPSLDINSRGGSLLNIGVARTSASRRHCRLLPELMHLASEQGAAQTELLDRPTARQFNGLAL